MRWDDIEILRLIDDLEEAEPAALSNGLYLIQKAAQRFGITLDQNRDYRPFAHELVLAHRDGYLDYSEQRSLGWGEMPDPYRDPNMWFQRIETLHLTSDGRDRARRRIFLMPPPDPAEDDGRSISALTLGEIAHAIADNYEAVQLPTFLTESGLPDDLVTREIPADRWNYLRGRFISLLQGGAASRRALRVFLGSWLAQRLHTGPDAATYRRVIDQLARQGWTVRDDRIVISEPVRGQAPTIGTEHSQTSAVLSMLERSFRQFGSGVRVLGNRKRGRPAFEVNDEYDVQDYLHSLLVVLFDDVRSDLDA